MSKNKLLVMMQRDPLGEGIGGMQTFIKGLIKCVPDEFEIELVGISTDKLNRPVGKWKLIRFDNKEFNFFPVLYTNDQNRRTKIPLSLRFSLALFRYKSKIQLEDRILEFHRIEPAVIFRNVKNKKVLFIHGNVEELYNPYSEIKWSKIPWLYFKFEKRIIPRMDRILVVSKEGLDFYKKKYSYMADKLSFVPTWADKSKFHPHSAKISRKKELLNLSGKFLISDEDRIILFVGRLEGSKNPLLLIDSFHNICISNKNVKLLIVGGGSLKEKVTRRIKKYKLENKVKLLGIFSQDRLAKLMRICDILVLTSACEGMPRVVIEALSSGLPVVSTDVGEVKRVVKDWHSGFLVSKHDAVDFANAVTQILKNKEKFSLDNCLDSMKDYSMDIVLNSIYEEFRSLVNINKLAE